MPHERELESEGDREVVLAGTQVLQSGVRMLGTEDLLEDLAIAEEKVKVGTEEDRDRRDLEEAVQQRRLSILSPAADPWALLPTRCF